MRILTVLSTASHRLATWRALAATGVLFAASAVLMFMTSLPFSIPSVTARCGTPPPDVQFFTSGDGVRQFLIGCGAEGRDAYRYLQLADLLYPAVSGLFLASASALILTRLVRPGSAVLALTALPLLGSIFDYLENVAAWTALTAFPQDAHLATDLLGVMSIAKQTTTWTAWGVVLAGLGCLLVRRGRRRLTTHSVHGRATSIPAAAPDHKLPA